MRRFDSLLKNTTWLAGSQLGIRLLRLFTIIIVSRLLLPEEYGIAAMVLTANELFHSLSHGAISSKLVQAGNDEIRTLQRTVYSMSWLLAIILAGGQALLAWPLAHYYQQPALLMPICLLATSYLLLPLATVQCAMLVREGRLDIIARSEMLQVACETLLTLGFAILGYGFWSLILPKLLVTPLWVLLIRAHCTYTPKVFLYFNDWRKVLGYGLPVAINDALTAMRIYIVSLLTGVHLGVEALGILYFALNAGLGISMSVIRVLNQALFSHLCQRQRDYKGNNDKAEFRETLIFALLFTSPIIVAQSVLAPWYVPLLFGQQWHDAGAVPILVMLSLSALPLPLASAASQSLRSRGLTGIELMAQVILTLLFCACLLIALPFGLQAIALSFVVTHLLFCPVFTWYVSRTMDRNQALFATD